jgi:hypothetical protein
MCQATRSFFCVRWRKLSFVSSLRAVGVTRCCTEMLSCRCPSFWSHYTNTGWWLNNNWTRITRNNYRCPWYGPDSAVLGSSRSYPYPWRYTGRVAEFNTSFPESTMAYNEILDMIGMGGSTIPGPMRYIFDYNVLVAPPPPPPPRPVLINQTVVTDNVRLVIGDDDTLQVATNEDQQSEGTSVSSIRELRCCVCLQGQLRVMFLNCRHMCLCRHCSPRVHTCPICNNASTAKVRVFVP